MFSRKECLTLGTAALLAGMGAYGDVSESFESATVDDAVTTLTGWGGYGYVTAEVPTSSVGFPISGNHTKVLAVEGYITCPNSMTAGSAAQVDMMVKVAKPDEELATTDLENAKIAVAIDQNGKLQVYCKPRAGGDAAWRLVSDTVYTEDTWIRVGLVFDYAAGFCQLRVNGQPAISANGALNATHTSTDGSWFKLAAGNTTDSIAELKVVGSTAIDDVVVTATADCPVYDGTIAADEKIGGTSIPRSWYDQQGVVWNASATAPDGSGMTVGEKYVAGLNVDDGKKFNMEDMTFTSDGSSTKVNIKFPGTGRTYKILGCDTKDGTYEEITGGEKVSESNGSTIWSVPLPTDKTVKYLKAQASVAAD